MRTQKLLTSMVLICACSVGDSSNKETASEDTLSSSDSTDTLSIASSSNENTSNGTAVESGTTTIGPIDTENNANEETATTTSGSTDDGSATDNGTTSTDDGTSTDDDSSTDGGTSTDGDTNGNCRIGILGQPGALPSSDFQGWLQDAGAEASRFGTATNHSLTATELEMFDIVILDRLTHLYPQDEQDILKTWIESGRGLISMAGYENSDTDRNQQNSLMSASGLQYIPAILLDPAEEQYPHAITNGVSGVQFYGGWRIAAIPPADLGEVWISLQGSSSDPLGVAKQMGKGRAIVYGDEWISFDSEWDSIPGVKKLWVNAVAWANNCVIVPQ